MILATFLSKSSRVLLPICMKANKHASCTMYVHDFVCARVSMMCVCVCLLHMQYLKMVW